MLSVLFWNIHKKRITELITSLAFERQADILFLAECEIDPAELLVSLNTPGASLYHYSPGLGCKKILVFTRFFSDYFLPQFETERLTIRRLQLPGMRDLLIGATHFPSKLNWRDESQIFECTRLVNHIREAERIVGHSRTILVGDFNMNPFEAGMISAGGLHGVMSRSIARQEKRIVQEEEYLFFYNPMWSLFGDASPGPPGTFYYKAAEHRVFFWNMFDQVLFRPGLLGSFRNENLEIVQTVNERQLLVNDIPDSRTSSDHLPLFFRFDVEEV